MKNNILVFFVILFFGQLVVGSEAEGTLFHAPLLAAAEKKDKELFKNLLMGQKQEQKRESILFFQRMNCYIASTFSGKCPDMDAILSEYINSDEVVERVMSICRFEIIDRDTSNVIKQALQCYDSSRKPNENDNYGPINNFAHIKRVNMSGDINKPEWRSPLSLAMGYGNYHSVELLLRFTRGRAAEYLQENEKNYTPKIFVGKIGVKCNSRIIEILLAHRLFNIVQQVYLHGLVQTRDKFFPVSEIMKNIVGNNNIDINATMANGVTPLIHALQKKDDLMVEYLLNLKNINVACVDGNNNAPLHFVVTMQFWEAQNDAKERMYYEAQEKKLPILQLLLKKSPNVLAQNNDGNTPLHLALIYATERPQTDEGKKLFEDKRKSEYENRKAIIDILRSKIEDKDLDLQNNKDQSIKDLLKLFDNQCLYIKEEARALLEQQNQEAREQQNVIDEKQKKLTQFWLEQQQNAAELQRQVFENYLEERVRSSSSSSSSEGENIAESNKISFARHMGIFLSVFVLAGLGGIVYYLYYQPHAAAV